MKNILKTGLLAVAFLIFSCEDQDNPTIKGTKEVPKIEIKKLVKSRLPQSEISGEADANSRRSVPGLSKFKGCWDGNSDMDYYFEAAWAADRVIWTLEDPYGNTSSSEIFSIQELNQVEFYIWDVAAVSGTWKLKYDSYFLAGYYDGQGNYIEYWQDSADGEFTFSLPLTGLFVSSGSSHNLVEYSDLHEYSLPPGYTASMIVDMAIDYENNLVFTYFNNGMRCKGTTGDLDADGPPVAYTLPPGYTISQIVGIDIDGDVERSYTWFSNGKRTIGSSTDLDQFGGPATYTLPINPLTGTKYATTDIIDIAIDGNVNWSWAYFNNGYKSAGSTTNLGSASAPAAYSLPCNYSISDIAGIACDGDTNLMWTWYKK